LGRSRGRSRGVLPEFFPTFYREFFQPDLATGAVGIVIVGALEQVDEPTVGQLACLPSELLPGVRIGGHYVVIGHHAAGVEVFGGFDQTLKRPIAPIV